MAAFALEIVRVADAGISPAALVVTSIGSHGREDSLDDPFERRSAQKRFAVDDADSADDFLDVHVCHRSP